MNVRRMTARAAALAAFATGLTGVGVFTGAAPAMACESTGNSHSFARHLPQVRPGQHGTYVLALQLNLRQEGYKLTGTGYYGSKTLAAVKSYQRKHHIKSSGIVGPKTWDSMIGRMPLELTGPQMVRYRPRYQVRPGDRSEQHVGMVFEVLQRTVTDYGRLSRAYGDGRSYNSGMQQLVKEFQRKNGINPSGIVGPKTWLSFYRVISATGEWGC